MESDFQCARFLYGKWILSVVRVPSTTLDAIFCPAWASGATTLLMLPSQCRPRASCSSTHRGTCSVTPWLRHDWHADGAYAWCVAGIIAGLLVQNSLKYLLSFGVVTQYLGYSSLKDFFPQMAIRPNPGCINALCGRAQVEHQVGSPRQHLHVHLRQKQTLVQEGGPFKPEHTPLPGGKTTCSRDFGRS